MTQPWTIGVLGLGLFSCTPALPVQLHLTHGPATAAQIQSDTSVWRQRLELAGAKQIKIAARGDDFVVDFRTNDPIPWDDLLTSSGDFSSGLGRNWSDLPGFGHALRTWSDTSDESGSRIETPPDTSRAFFFGIVPPQTCARLDSFLAADPGTKALLRGKGKPILSRSPANWASMDSGYFLYVVTSEARELRKSDLREVKLLQPLRGKYASVEIDLTPEGGEVFKRLTTARVGQSMPILIGGRVALCPRIMDPITGSHLSLGESLPDEAHRLVALLKSPVLQARWIAKP